MSTILRVALTLASAPLAIALGLAFGHDWREREASRGLIHRHEGFVGAQTCLRCHPEQHASWARTHHAQMTRRPSAEAVAGRFEGQALTFYEKTARPLRDGERFWIELPAEGAGTRRAEVALVVGSRRYQQYFEKTRVGEGAAEAAVYRRLPILWHLEAERWLHINDVFLQADDPDWSQHRSIWNQNCIYCHNTAPRPGYLAREHEREIVPDDARRYDSRVAELGIACESCHGPGAEHVARYESPAARYLDRMRSSSDALIVNPARLDKQASVDVCGQCHGQRLPKPTERHFVWRTSGPTYRSGERLAEHVTPLSRDTTLGGDEGEAISLRFWADGTPRLTACEYQGVTSSPCFERGEMTCLSCHVMHGGDVRGQIEPQMRGNRACVQCHQEIGREIEAHTKHGASSSGSQCMDCHMPRIVFGVATVHRSHRIEIPDPARDVEAGRPNACTMCHVDKSSLWAAERMRAWWGPEYRDPAKRPDKAPLEVPDAVASLLSGDAVQRVVYAAAAARADGPVADADNAEMRVALHATLLDAYPSVRWAAQKSLLAIEARLATGIEPALRDWRHDAPRGAREASARAFLASFAARGRGKLRALGAGRLLSTELEPKLDALLALLGLQAGRGIGIGE